MDAAHAVGREDARAVVVSEGSAGQDDGSGFDLTHDAINLSALT